MKTKVIAVSVCRDNDNAIFGESATHINIEDEAGGPFIVISQCHDNIQPGELRFDADELEHIFSAATKLYTDYTGE